MTQSIDDDVPVTPAEVRAKQREDARRAPWIPEDPELDIGV